MKELLSSVSQSSTAPEMDVQAPAVVDDDPLAYPATMWDWGDLLDFVSDEQLPIPLDSDQLSFSPLPPPPPHPPPRAESESPRPGWDRVRKRDPRLTCSNFLEGRIPCSCPEIDQKLEDEGLPGKKRVRNGVRGGSGVARCQVPGCEADISELKGYHKRHRVCLRCANASSVVLNGETKRYCQQCGKYVPFRFASRILDSRFRMESRTGVVRQLP